MTAAAVAPGSLEASALSTRALAAIAAPAGSVGTAALANGAVTESKIADGSITARKLAMRVVTADGSAQLASIASATATCPPGTRAYSGGVTIDDASTLIPISALRQSAPVADAEGMPVGWVGTVANTANLGGAFTFHVLAICG